MIQESLANTQSSLACTSEPYTIINQWFKPKKEMKTYKRNKRNSADIHLPLANM